MRCNKILITEIENIDADVVIQKHKKENFIKIIKTRLLLDITIDFDEDLRGLKELPCKSKLEV